LGQFDAAIHSTIARCSGSFGRDVGLDVGCGPGYVSAAATARGAIPRGVRTAGLLARQTPARLQAIQSAIEESVRRYAKGDGFAIPKATYVIAVGNKVRMEKEEERKQRAAA